MRPLEKSSFTISINEVKGDADNILVYTIVV